MKQAQALKTGRDIVVFLQADSDMFVQRGLLKAARKCPTEVAEALLPVLSQSMDDFVFEFAVLFFAEYGEPYVRQIQEAMMASRFAYGVSVLALLMGFIDNEECALQIVWDLYRLWEPDHQETLAQGPLLGLWQYSDRRFGHVKK